MAHRIVTSAGCLAFLVTALGGVAAAQPPAAAQPSAAAHAPKELRWSVEALGDRADLSPADFNAYSAWRDALYTTYYERQMEYDSSHYPNFTSSFVKDGEFPKLDRAWVGGVRVAYRLASRLWATAGVQVLSRAESASIHREYQSSWVDPNSRALVTADTKIFTLGPDLLRVRSYAPSVGVRLAVLRARPVSIDAVLLTGIAWADCRLEANSFGTGTYYRASNTSSTWMAGHGIAATAEVGLRAGWNVSRRWGAFVEGTYLRQRFSKITGTGERSSKRQDGDATSVEMDYFYSASGRWRMVPYSVRTAFGTIGTSYPTITDSESYLPFALDLSGARARVGLALRLW